VSPFFVLAHFWAQLRKVSCHTCPLIHAKRTKKAANDSEREFPIEKRTS